MKIGWKECVATSYHITVRCTPTTTEWYKNGQIKTKIEYFGQTGIYKEWYENGQIKSDADINSPLGDIASYSKSWCPNGFQIQDLKRNQGKNR